MKEHIDFLCEPYRKKKIKSDLLNEEELTEIVNDSTDEEDASLELSEIVNVSTNEENASFELADIHTISSIEDNERDSDKYVLINLCNSFNSFTKNCNSSMKFQFEYFSQT